MLVELTPRSAEIIAREQAKHGAVSPEHLIEQALEAYDDALSSPAVRTVEKLKSRVEAAWQDAEQNGSLPADESWEEINKSLRQ